MEAQRKGEMSSDAPSNGKDRAADAQVSTWLAIPYMPDDRGRPLIERPLNQAVIPNQPVTIAWLCPSIIVNGVPGQNTFERGKPTSVTVDVVNWGAGTSVAPVYVRVWWSDPSTAFTKLHPFGQAVMFVPADGVPQRSDAVIGTIPTWAPEHVCLLVNVESPLDHTAGGPPNPAADRHWAQFNIAEVEAAVTGVFQFFFQIGNPLARQATFTLTARPLDAERSALVERLGRRAIVTAEPARLALTVTQEADDALRRGREQLEIALKPRDRRTIAVTGQLPEAMEPGTRIAFELLQRQRDSNESIFEGTLGLIVSAFRRR